MITLGTPNISLNLDPVEWLVLLGGLTLIIALRYFLKRRKAKRDERAKLSDSLEKGDEEELLD
ncbi:MAG: preprotein translocase subunit YajC [Bacteroidia bacterium]|jgi:preprotein translocase subunit YajC